MTSFVHIVLNLFCLHSKVLILLLIHCSLLIPYELQAHLNPKDKGLIESNNLQWLLTAKVINSSTVIAFSFQFFRIFLSLIHFDYLKANHIGWGSNPTKTHPTEQCCCMLFYYSLGNGMVLQNIGSLDCRKA